MRRSRFIGNGRTQLLLNGIILPFQYFVVCAPFPSKLVAVKPVVGKLVSESFQGLLSVGAEFYHGTPCFGFLLEVLHEGDESDGCRRRRICWSENLKRILN